MTSVRADLRPEDRLGEVDRDHRGRHEDQRGKRRDRRREDQQHDEHEQSLRQRVDQHLGSEQVVVDLDQRADALHTAVGQRREHVPVGEQVHETAGQERAAGDDGGEP